MASLLFPVCPFLFLLITVDQCRSVNKQRQPYYVSVYTSACFSSVASHRVRLADACSQHPGHKTPRSAQCLRTATAHSNPERGQRPAAPQRPLPAPPATPPGGAWPGGRWAGPGTSPAPVAGPAPRCPQQPRAGNCGSAGDLQTLPSAQSSQPGGREGTAPPCSPAAAQERDVQMKLSASTAALKLRRYLLV